jgi:3-isopropylmalate/(R)-2-methylmalate dehydratase small subunit
MEKSQIPEEYCNMAKTECVHGRTNGLLKGKAWKFGDNISTDHIQPSRYFHLRNKLDELSKHVLEGARQDFPTLFVPGDFVVGGRNFGLGSSRESAPAIIKEAGLTAVLAKSFARIFFRNAVNIGLPLIICDTDRIEEGNEIEVEMGKGVIYNRSLDIKIPFQPLPSVMIRILNDGGLLQHIQKHGGFNIELF